jgi:hypothetical protein
VHSFVSSLVGRVVDHELDDDPNPSFVTRADEVREVSCRSVLRMDTLEVGDAIAIVAELFTWKEPRQTIPHHVRAWLESRT